MPLTPNTLDEWDKKILIEIGEQHSKIWGYFETNEDFMKWRKQAYHKGYSTKISDLILGYVKHLEGQE